MDIQGLLGKLQRTWSLALGFVALTVSVSCGLAAPPALGVTIYRIDTESFPEVRCYIVVRDEEGRSLAGLTSEEFVVEENGVRVTDAQVQTLRPEQQRIAVVLVIDCSGSMRGRPLQRTVHVIREFISRLSRTDLCGFVAVGGNVTARPCQYVKAVQVGELLASPQGRGKTPLYDGIAKGIALVANTHAERRAVVVVTDGQDNASKTPLAKVIKRARGKGVAVFTIGIGHEVDTQQLQGLAKSTGGLYFAEGSAEGLRTLFERIASDLKSTYLLVYRSPHPPLKPSWRRIVIEARAGPRRGSASAQYATAGYASEIEEGLWASYRSGVLGVAIISFVLLDGLLLIQLFRARRRKPV